MLRKGEGEHHRDRRVVHATRVLAKIHDWLPALVVVDHGTTRSEEHLGRVLITRGRASFNDGQLGEGFYTGKRTPRTCFVQCFVSGTAGLRHLTPPSTKAHLGVDGGL